MGYLKDIVETSLEKFDDVFGGIELLEVNALKNMTVKQSNLATAFELLIKVMLYSFDEIKRLKVFLKRATDLKKSDFDHLDGKMATLGSEHCEGIKQRRRKYQIR